MVLEDELKLSEIWKRLTAEFSSGRCALLHTIDVIIWSIRRIVLHSVKGKVVHGKKSGASSAKCARVGKYDICVVHSLPSNVSCRQGRESLCKLASQAGLLGIVMDTG